MIKILLFACGLFIFSCKSKTIEDQSVEIGSGTEISPQVVGVEDSAKRLKVDTVNSAEEAHAKEGKEAH